MSLVSMESLDLAGRRVLIREDLNVPLREGKITSDARIVAALPTLKKALAAGAKVMVASHLGRPVEGSFDPSLSLQPVAERLSQLLCCPVRLVRDWTCATRIDQSEDEVVLLENVRFNVGEKANDPKLARAMADLCDVYVMDAFGTAHRAQASTCGVLQHVQTACAGPLLIQELDALSCALKAPKKPMVAIVGGSKVSSKLTVLKSLASICDQLIVGGGIANTFLAAAGHPIGQSLCEPDLIPAAKALIDKIDIPLPTDVVVAQKFDKNATAIPKNVDDVSDQDMILDIGPRSAAKLAHLLHGARTILWNGPAGVFEFDQFGAGTMAISLAIADSPAFSIAGGGDTLAAIEKYGIKDRVSYISTGGGAFLEYIEGKTLPAIAALQARSR